MKFAVQLQSIFLAAILVAFACAEVQRVPLRSRHSHIAQRNNNAADQIEEEGKLFRRAIEHMTRRYGQSDLEKRIVSASILNKKIDLAFSKEEDKIQRELEDAFKKAEDKVLKPLLGTDSAGDDDSNFKQSTQQRQTARKSAGRYAGAAGTAKAKIALTDVSNEYEFVGEISIGTPPQTFPIDPDTGSADLWVVDSTCTDSDCGVNAHPTFKASQSSSDAPIAGKDFDLQYTVGDVSGKFVRETIHFGGIQIVKQTIGLANHTSPDWKTDKASGVLGLGFRAITSGNQRPIIQNLSSQGKLKDKIISFAFGRQKSGTQGKSEMNVGSINTKLIKGSVSYYPVTKVAYWQMKMKSFTAGTGSGVQNVDIILDTGSTLIAGPSDLVSSFWKGVNGSQLSSDGTYYSYPCDAQINAKLTMPDGRVFPIDDKDLNFGVLSSGSNRCRGAVINSGGSAQMVFGLAALKNFYTVFDFGQNRIGMAKYNF